MATPSWLLDVGCCVVGRDGSEECVESEAPVKTVVESREQQEWYPYLLQQIQALQPDAIVGKVVEQRGHYWEPAEEPVPALSRTSSGFARLTAARRSARRGSPQSRLHEALSRFYMAEAREELELLEGSGDDALQQLDAPTLERIRRIGDSALQNLRWWSQAGCPSGRVGGNWPINGHNEALRLQWGFRLQDGLIHATFSTEVIGGDIPRAVAALCEVQLYGSFNDDFVEASALEQDGAANDSIWNLVTHNKVLDVRADNIWQVTVTDALEEQAGAIIIDLSTPEQEGIAKLRGTPLPCKREGFGRQVYGRSTYFLFPTDGGIGQEASFRLVNYSVTRPVKKLAYILSALPNFAQSRILCAGAERAVTKLKQHITMSNNKSLDSAMRTSPRTSVYEAIREHLAADQASEADWNQEEENLRFYSFEDDAGFEAFVSSVS